MDFFREQLRESSFSNGYRYMHLKVSLASFIVDRKIIRSILRFLHPEGVKMRAVHKLHRRGYISEGPSEVLYIDGYDKLKPFVFVIDRCIDGFSWKKLWFKIGTTNNDPVVTEYYFLECLHQVKTAPKVIRSDRSTQNVYISAIQHYLGRKDENVDSCFRYGRSTGNQITESFRLWFRKSNSNWWINYFKDMRDQNIFHCTKNEVFHYGFLL